MALIPGEPIPQPKILSVITIPTGGWTLKIYLSTSSQFDQAVTATMAAGDYFMAWDAQSDDFLFELSEKLNAAIAAVGAPWDAGAEVVFSIDADTHKVKIGFDGDDYTSTQRDVKIAWTENDGDDIGAVLGFETSADDTATGADNPTIEGDYHHAYGWYADEDGLLDEDLVEDESIPDAAQSVAPSGHVKTHYIGSRFMNRLSLVFVPRIKMFSRDVGYASAPLYPYERNEPLECWWMEARQGKRFRVYRDGQINVNRAVEQGSYTGSTSTTLTDTSKSWNTAPQRWPGRLLYTTPWSANTSQPSRNYIASNTATVLTASNDWLASYSLASNGGSNSYYIFEQRYGTYWLDMSSLRSFLPLERKNIDRYDITLPLLRYEA